MLCPQCGCEFREGFTRCSDCDVDLVPALPVEGEASDSVLVRFFETGDVVLIAALKSVLEDAGIEFETRNEALQDLIGGGRMAGFNPVLGPVQFWVREEDERTARELVRQTEESSEELLDFDDAAQDRLPAPSSRPVRRVIAAGVLNVFLFPFSTLMAYSILLATPWGQRHPASVPPTSQALAGVLFVALCLIWLIRPKVAVWLQLTLAVPMVWTAFAPDRFRWREVSRSANLEENGLLVIATVFALAGAVAIVLALLPRLVNRGT